VTTAKSPTQTTQVRLQAVINQSRQIMRKDAGLNGELDRLPQLAWLLFLKAFDDLEEEREALEEGYRPVLPERLRWRTWAAAGDVTGAPFLRLVNDDLLPTLRELRGSGKPGDPRDTLARVFQDTTNRMLSGHLLRQLVDQVNKVEFSHRDEMHAMAVFYETMLREMRDAAGDSGEFYTPRPLIRFIVEQVDPHPGETVLDPAAGTGGFLIEAYKHMTGGNVSASEVEHVKAGLRGIEKKPMPHLLGQMNMLLHGIDRPNFVEQNSLNLPLADVRRAGVDVVLTNPPFGGEEEKLVQANFPTQFRTAETAWLFLQSVMARIERSPHGRCGIVVPNSVLFDTGVGGKIKADLMRRFNLHTVLRLPNGVFAPYTIIPSNVLFFEKGVQGPVWFYEIPAPEDRKNYTKTKPMRYEEFDDCATWWGGHRREGRIVNERAWRVDAKTVRESAYNLDLHNPHRPDDLEHRSPKELVAELIKTERELLHLFEGMLHEIDRFEL
jgi:type I restriction enzyme M protein